MTTYGGTQPIRNAEASNLALDLLALGPIPGSTFNYGRDLRIWSDPALKLTPTSLAKTVAWGIDPPTGASFTIQNAGVGTLDYTIESNATWVAPSPGTTPGNCGTETDTIELVFTTASLAPGPYVATLNGWNRHTHGHIGGDHTQVNPTGCKWVSLVGGIAND